MDDRIALRDEAVPCSARVATRARGGCVAGSAPVPRYWISGVYPLDCGTARAALWLPALNSAISSTATASTTATQITTPLRRVRVMRTGWRWALRLWAFELLGLGCLECGATVSDAG